MSVWTSALRIVWQGRKQNDDIDKSEVPNSREPHTSESSSQNDLASYRQISKPKSNTTVPQGRTLTHQELRFSTEERNVNDIGANLVDSLEKVNKLLQKTQAEKQQLSMTISKLRREFEYVCDDNRSLRAQIVNMTSSQGPNNDDGHYTQRLTQLNETIKSWVASSFKAKQVDHDLTDVDEEPILHVLMAPKNDDQHFSVHFSKGSIREIFYVPRKRMALVRHLLAFWLCVYVFSPFCFGLEQNTDLTLRGVLSWIIENGTAYLKVC